jgi:hypothetical protein
VAIEPAAQNLEVAMEPAARHLEVTMELAARHLEVAMEPAAQHPEVAMEPAARHLEVAMEPAARHLEVAMELAAQHPEVAIEATHQQEVMVNYTAQYPTQAVESTIQHPAQAVESTAQHPAQAVESTAQHPPVQEVEPAGRNTTRSFGGGGTTAILDNATIRSDAHLSARANNRYVADDSAATLADTYIYMPTDGTRERRVVAAAAAVADVATVAAEAEVADDAAVAAEAEVADVAAVSEVAEVVQRLDCGPDPLFTDPRGGLSARSIITPLFGSAMLVPFTPTQQVQFLAMCAELGPIFVRTELREALTRLDFSKCVSHNYQFHFAGAVQLAGPPSWRALLPLH